MNNFIYNYILSDIGRTIWDSFENHPEEWEQREHTILNHDKEVCLWTANGVWFFDGYPYREYYNEERKYSPRVIKFDYIERHFLYRKYKKCIKWFIHNDLIERFK